MNTDAWQNYQNQSVCDLAWLLSAPRMYEDWDVSHFWIADWRKRLQDLDSKPESLLTHLAKCKSHFMGSYFESLFSYAVRYFSTLEIIFEHQQVVREGTTLGEVDMLVREPSGMVLQLEVAIKFYLQTPVSDVPGWIGPNKNDSFSKKYARAKQHQLNILKTKEGKALLSQFHIDGEVTPGLVMFGILFLAWEEAGEILSGPQLSEPFGPNMRAAQGRWVRVESLPSLREEVNRLTELHKPHWMTFGPASGETSLPLSQWETLLKSSFATDPRPRLFWASLQKTSIQHGFPLFIVPQNW